MNEEIISTIRLRNSTRERLKSLGRKGETYDDIIDRLIKEETHDEMIDRLLKKGDIYQ